MILPTTYPNTKFVEELVNRLTFSEMIETIQCIATALDLPIVAETEDGGNLAFISVYGEDMETEKEVCICLSCCSPEMMAQNEICSTGACGHEECQLDVKETVDTSSVALSA